MTRIGLVSDTHGHWDERLAEFFFQCDEVWHAGDIGNLHLPDHIIGNKILRAVHGNIDDYKTRLQFPELIRFRVEGVNVMIKHIVGYPGNYDKEILKSIQTNPPDLLVAGHSHILKVIFDKKFNLMFMNPGAYGISGFHRVRTAVRFEIEGKAFANMEILEISR